MEYRKIGNTDLELSVITFGSWAVGGWMWGSSDRMKAVHAIRAAFDEGVTSIDTAPVYGQGTSESIVGQALEIIPRDQVQILTKYGMRWDLAKGEFAFKSKDNSGKPIDIYKYAGKESIIKDKTTPQSETFEAVERLIEQGKVRYAGVCNYDVSLMEEAGKYINLVSDQIPFSMVNRKTDETTIPWCMKHNKSVLAYSPMERGLLTGKITPGYKFAEGDHRANNSFFTENCIRQTNAFLDKLRPLAREKNVALSQLVLRWTIEHPGITVALVGARDSVQAIENAHAVDVKLTQEDIAFINKELPDISH